MEYLTAALNPDDFDTRFRRQGWLSFEYVRPEYPDLQLLSQRWTHSMTKSYSPQAFFDLFGENTFRKLLRRIYTQSPCSSEDLARICSNEALLAEHLDFLVDQELAEQAKPGVWQKAARFQHITNIGRTLEWYVARWFGWILNAPARYGVHVDDLPEGGDIDVVAFVDSLRVAVECKSGRDITERHLDLFIQRTEDFAPDISILLIDTDAQIDQHIQTLNRIRPLGNPFAPQNEKHELYWGLRNGYVVNTKKSIGQSLASVLRLYHSKVKHIAFAG